jgi:hypothetical protein
VHPRKRACQVKLMLDWGVHDRKLKLMDQHNYGNCPICMAPDSLHHILYQCNHESVNMRRTKWKTDLEAVIRSQITLAHEKTARQQRQTKELWEALQDLTTAHSGRELVWRGLWTFCMREELDGRIGYSRYSIKWTSKYRRRQLRQAIRIN